MNLIVQTVVYECEDGQWYRGENKVYRVTDVPYGLSNEALNQLAMTFERGTAYTVEQLVDWTVSYEVQTCTYEDVVNSLMEEV